MYTGGIDHRKNIEGLIRAFTKLPTSLRKAHQLAVVCSTSPENRHILQHLATQQGLSKDELVLTGFVPENDLVNLYNLCALFVFPSWHEGFGLPVLEAMRCGAPVIGANTSSLPEVIGWDEALFDPRSDEEIAKTIEHALSDATFRSEIIRHGKKQSTKFSWDKSAHRAIAAMERLLTKHQTIPAIKEVSKRRPRLAYISPLPPEKTGIADYSAELLPALSSFYEIKVIAPQAEISSPWIMANSPIRSVQWFIENSGQFDRILYHFGNSPFHKHMFELIETIPGVVVLHDFFLSGITSHIDWIGMAPGYWTKELLKSHGYKALSDRFHAKDNEDIIWKYPCNLSVIQASLALLLTPV